MTTRNGLATAAVVLLVATSFLLLLEDTADAKSNAHCTVIAHRAHLDGTENQAAGVTAAATSGWAEVDARVTAGGRIVAVHDARMGRLSGGASDAAVADLTLAQLRALPYAYGRRIELTRTLVAEAARLDTPIMVTVNSWTQVKAAGHATAVLDSLHAMALAHPRPHVVYFGGSGPEAAMRVRHPDAATFHRYDHNQTPADITADAAAEGVDLVALPKRRHTAALVDALRAGGHRVATRQIETPEEARAAQAAGITTMQGDDPALIATEWCE